LSSLSNSRSLLSTVYTNVTHTHNDAHKNCFLSLTDLLLPLDISCCATRRNVAVQQLSDFEVLLTSYGILLKFQEDCSEIIDAILNPMSK
jgi:hypothetical protein